MTCSSPPHRRPRSTIVGALALVLTACGTSVHTTSTTTAVHTTSTTTAMAPTSTIATTATTGTTPPVGPLTFDPAARSLVPLTAAEEAQARVLIAGLTTKGRGPKTGYERDRFGSRWTDDTDAPFGHNGCDTRNDILRRDLTAIAVRPNTHDCVVITGTLADPYTGRPISFAKAQAIKVQIDHVVPLSYAWQLGAARWTEAQRTRFANDPVNLLAVDGPANESKGDSGPASWLPPNRSIRCAYVARFAAAATAYRLAVTPADKAMAQQQCAPRPR